ncbi:MAG: hypothetical protein WCV72_02110 [Patescibacteria group bacterium]
MSLRNLATEAMVEVESFQDILDQAPEGENLQLFNLNLVLPSHLRGDTELAAKRLSQFVDETRRVIGSAFASVGEKAEIIGFKVAEKNRRDEIVQVLELSISISELDLAA